MKYIISILFIVLFFTSCQKKVVVLYDNLQMKRFKHVLKKEKEDIKVATQINKNINIIDNNITLDENNISLFDDNITLNENNLTCDLSYNISENDISAPIAILYSSNVIGKYAIKASEVVTYSSFNNNDNFNIINIDMDDESIFSLKDNFNKLNELNISKVLLYLTPSNINNLKFLENNNSFDIYLPLINISKSDINNTKIIFGGISYKEQLEVLKKNASSHIVEVYDNSKKSIKLHNDLNKTKVTSYKLSGKYPNYNRFIKEHKSLQNSSLILNMNIIKNAIFMSQISASDDLNINEILSTQSTYSPLLFTLTQVNDTKNLIVANSILYANDEVNEINDLLHNDIEYDWVNYSTVLGLEYLKYKNNILFNNINIINSQVQYPVNLYKTNKKNFHVYFNE